MFAFRRRIFSLEELNKSQRLTAKSQRLKKQQPKMPFLRGIVAKAFRRKTSKKYFYSAIGY
jgi:hypothetical protein